MKEYNNCKGVSGILNALISTFLCNRFRNIIKEPYDEVIYYNLDLSILNLYDILRSKNTSVLFSRYEEGLLSYHHSFTYPKIMLFLTLRKLLGKDNPYDEPHIFYCFYPKLYHGKENVVGLPIIDKTLVELRRILGQCFEFRFTDNYYSEKYIFFTSVYDFEGEEPIGEYEVIEKIAQVVGKENLLIKKHPRDSRTVYEDNGFKVDANSNIPWEITQFHIDLKDKILLTVNSGAILSSALLFKCQVRSYFVYKLCNIKKNTLAKESIAEINAVMNSSFLKDSVPNLKVLELIGDLI